jgi:hypothetical protein
VALAVEADLDGAVVGVGRQEVGVVARRIRLDVLLHHRIAGVGGRIGGRERLVARLVHGAARLARALGGVVVRRAVGVRVQPVGEGGAEAVAHDGQLHPVLRPLRPGQRGQHGRQVEAERLAETRLGGVIGPEQALGPGVGLDAGHHLVGAAGHAQVAQRLVIDREDGGGGPELGRHVADRGAVGEAQARQARPVELDELADHAVGAEHLGDVQHQVRGSGARRQLAVEPEADHDRHRLIERLAQQGGLGLDAADAPADDAKPVDHRRVRIGADEGVGQEHAVALGHHVGEVLEVDLVHDPGAGRHDPEVLERLLRPAQERVALAVALVLALDVDEEGGVRAELVDLHRVVDDEIRRHERVDAGRVAAHLGHRIAHGGQVDHARDAGEVLENDARRHERQLGLCRPLRIPGRQGAHVVRAHEVGLRRGAAQHVLEQDLDGVRQPIEIGGIGSIEPVVGVLAVVDAERVTSAMGINGWLGRHGRLLSSPRPAAASVEDRRRTGAPVPGRVVAPV